MKTIPIALPSEVTSARIYAELMKLEPKTPPTPSPETLLNAYRKRFGVCEEIERPTCNPITPAPEHMAEAGQGSTT